MAPGGEVFSRLIHALGVVHIDAVNADAGITHIDKYLGRSRFLQNPYIPRQKAGSEKYGSQDVIFVKISLHRFELFGSKSLHLDDNTSS